MKKNTYFGDPLRKKYNFFIARGVQLDNGVDPQCSHMGNLPHPIPIT